MKSIEGKFEVVLEPLAAHLHAEHGMSARRMAITKTYDGALAGRSIGEMLSVTTPQQGSAGYVAFEQFVGVLDDKAGSFVMQHSGTTNKGSSMLQIGIVADSATGQLTGLAGTLQIKIEHGKHFYTLQYEL